MRDNTTSPTRHRRLHNASYSNLQRDRRDLILASKRIPAPSPPPRRSRRIAKRRAATKDRSTSTIVPPRSVIPPSTTNLDHATTISSHAISPAPPAPPTVAKARPTNKSGNKQHTLNYEDPNTCTVEELRRFIEERTGEQVSHADRRRCIEKVSPTLATEERRL